MSTIKLLNSEFCPLVKKFRSCAFRSCDYSQFRSYASPPFLSGSGSSGELSVAQRTHLPGKDATHYWFFTKSPLRPLLYFTADVDVLPSSSQFVTPSMATACLRACTFPLFFCFLGLIFDVTESLFPTLRFRAGLRKRRRRQRKRHPDEKGHFFPQTATFFFFSGNGNRRRRSGTGERRESFFSSDDDV